MARSTDVQKSERLNAAHSLLARGIGMQEAVVSLSHQFGISRRQAYRYLQEAGTIGHPVRDCRKFWGLAVTRAFSGLSLTWGTAWAGS